ncbi:hypothetical protein P3T35_003199 [Kitasatospora sp. GP30]|jgi:hypothetical protein|uniref:DUF397 domain-containing protein n=1 Tax=Kitasatospora sp. GP30 TaxID=3035084 RepID=UPI000C7091BE|nr:DUF397 domain-containing protein [Kitasatospora sp. GP30]MDH6141182.1 hypothetical protein [Kitasatospora sp. GP30]
MNTIWRKSTHSQSGGECIEWAPAYIALGVVPLRDSKNPGSPALAFTPEGLAAFVQAVKHRIPR